MMIDYVNRLKQLQEDRIKFEKQKDRTNYKEKINKQESKYQAYIIDQMNQKNRLIAASKIQGILSGEVNQINANVFQALQTFNNREVYRNNVKPVGMVLNDGSEREESISVNFILVKLCTDAVRRVLNKATLENTRLAFSQLHRFSKKKKILEKGVKVMQGYYLKHSFRRLVTHQTKLSNQLETQGRFFDESFSVIYKNDKPCQKKGPIAMSESYLSFILDKDTLPQADYQGQREAGQIIARQRQEISSLQEDLSYLRSLLAEKTLQLKKKTLECDKIQEQYHQKQYQSNVHESSANDSRNSSYISEIQRQVTGGKRIRKNVSQLSDSSPSLKGEEISRELLSKYMKQSFLLKQNMDLARELCIQIHQKLRPELRREMQSVIKTLTIGQESSVVDEV